MIMVDVDFVRISTVAIGLDEDEPEYEPERLQCSLA